MSGNVYFIRCQEFVKIGFAKDVLERIASLQTGCPYELELIAVVPGVESLERIFHKVLDNKRYRGEWFSLDRKLQFRIRAMMKKLREGEVTEVTREAHVKYLLGMREKREKRQMSWQAEKRSNRADYFARLADRSMV